MSTLLVMTVLAAACGSPKPSAAPFAGSGAVQAPPGAQPAEVMQRPEHYLSRDRVIGFVLDRSATEARLRYDGTQEVLRLDARPGTGGRVDYVLHGTYVLLNVYRDGRVVAYPPERPNGVDVVREEALREPEAGPPPVVKDQPVDVKLRLGHYISGDRTIGLVLDRRQTMAKLRLDGSTQVTELDPHPAPDRTDYVSHGRVVVQVWQDGRVVFFHPDRPNGVTLKRDGDADPI